MRRWSIGVAIWLVSCLLWDARTQQIPGFPPGTFTSRIPREGGGGGGGGGNVTVDQVGTYGYQANCGTSGSTCTWGAGGHIFALTITGGLTNPGLVCVVERGGNGTSDAGPPTLSWGAQGMTLLTSVDSGTHGSIVYGLRNPTSGSQGLVLSAATAAETDNFVDCVSFSNVNQTNDATAFPAQVTATTGTSTTISSAASHYVIAGVTNTGASINVLATSIFSDAVTGSSINAGGQRITGAATVTVGLSSGTLTTLGATDIAP